MPEATRRLYWNAQSTEGDPPKHNFIFLIVNGNREAERVIQKAKEVLHPTEEWQTRTIGTAGKRLRYRLETFTSYREQIMDIPWGRIYRGSVQRNRDLTCRKTLVDYVDKLMSQSEKDFAGAIS